MTKVVDKYYNFRMWKLGLSMDITSLKAVREEMTGSDFFKSDMEIIDKQIADLEGD